MDMGSIIISACITIFSLGLLMISLASYRKYKNLKLLVISFVFLIFLIKGILLSLGLFYNEIKMVTTDSLSVGFFDLLILVLLFIATLKR